MVARRFYFTFKTGRLNSSVIGDFRRTHEVYQIVFILIFIFEWFSPLRFNVDPFQGWSRSVFLDLCTCEILYVVVHTVGVSSRIEESVSEKQLLTLKEPVFICDFIPLSRFRT